MVSFIEGLYLTHQGSGPKSTHVSK
jgi:hypothetical protein